MYNDYSIHPATVISHSQTTMSEPTTRPTVKDTLLETGASLTQDFQPMKAICAHLHAFHVYADEPQRVVEADHYCCHIEKDVSHGTQSHYHFFAEFLQIRQCLIYSSSSRDARLIGVEYIVTAALFETLPAEEKKLWHSHDYEVRSGLLVMPNRNVPQSAWELAETKEMEQLVGTYGKTWHLWQVDRGDRVPLGMPKLMGSFTKDDQVSNSCGSMNFLAISQACNAACAR